MKTGAGDDPFAIEDDGSEEESDPEPESPGESVPADDRGREIRTRSEDPVQTGGSADEEDDPDEAPSEDGGGDDEPLAREEIPWVLRRSAVKEDRDNVHQFFLRDEYATREDDLRDEVAELLDVRTKEVKKLDLREAMYAVVDAEDLAEELREWGYEYVD